MTDKNCESTKMDNDVHGKEQNIQIPDYRKRSLEKGKLAKNNVVELLACRNCGIKNWQAYHV